MKNDRYEWTSFDLTQFEKIIYIRDLYKSWYVTGINSEIDCIDKLIELIAEETQGYDLVCAGSSAGGYLAIILGCKLNAKYILAFSPQVELNNKWCAGWNRFLQHYKSDPERNQYYNIISIIENAKTPIYYIYPMQSEQDQYQYSFVREYHNVKVFCFNSKRHGVVMLNSSLRKFVSLSQEEVDDLYKKYRKKKINRWRFSIQTIGFMDTFKKEFCPKMIKKIKGKISI